MDENAFMRLIEETKSIFIPTWVEVLGRDQDTIENFIEDMVSTIRKYHNKGLLPRDYATIMAELSLNAVVKLDTLAEAEIFAQNLRNDAERTRKIISENWPPPE